MNCCRHAREPTNGRMWLRAASPRICWSVAGGALRIVDSHNFPAAKTIASALAHVKPGAMRELHWHPNASEWQCYISGSARQTLFSAPGHAVTMNFNPKHLGD